MYVRFARKRQKAETENIREIKKIAKNAPESPGAFDVLYSVFGERCAFRADVQFAFPFSCLFIRCDHLPIAFSYGANLMKFPR